MLNFGGVGLGICFLVSFISFGYMTYQWFGGISLILTIVFSGFMIIAFNAFIKEQKNDAEASVHRHYEQIQRH